MLNCHKKHFLQSLNQIMTKLAYNYFDYSKNLLVGIIFILPFLFLYELICLFYFRYSDYEIRNTADVIIHDLFYYFGSYSQFAYSISLLLVVLFIYYYNVKKNKNLNIIPIYLLLIALEGIIYGFILTMTLNNPEIFNIRDFYQSDLLLSLYLCIGAGVWEEILFRLIIYNLCLLSLFKILFKKSGFFNIFISIFFCSFLFSLFHYIGANGDIFNISSFYYRFIGGLYLTTLYHYRGFGVASMAHLSYDFILVSLPLI